MSNYSSRLLVGLLLVGVSLAASPSAWAQEYEITPPPVVLTHVPFDITVNRAATAGTPALLQMRTDGATFDAERLADGSYLVSGITVRATGPADFELVEGGRIVAEATTRAIPGWVSILPPLLAILSALIIRNVIPALFLGLWFGAMAVNGFSITGAFTGMLDAFQVYLLTALFDEGRISIILFSFMIGGMVGIISKNGGMQGVVDKIVPLAGSPKKGQAATGLLGLVVFFDDYANTLVVGNTMRPVTDRLRVSREKLAYLVDSTAAPVACVALVTTWIGYEVGLITEAVELIDGYDEAAYAVFLNSIAYNFYPLLAIVFVFIVAFSGRDFGPMYEAEARARTTGQVLSSDARVDESAGASNPLAPADGRPHRAVNAALPVLVLVGGVLTGLYVTGSGDTLSDIIGSADSYKALMWASLSAVVVAAALSISQGILTLADTVDAWYAGLKTMLLGMIILCMAWALSDVTNVLNTGGYLVGVLGDALTPGLVPAIVFVLSAGIAFATGSSWGTMGILMPLVLPLTWAVLQANGMANPDNYSIIYSAVASVLAGSVWGDHCSPISDTTILSSTASGSDHIAHVRTQLPYALLVGGVGLLIGTVPTGFGFPWWLSLIICAAVLWATHRYVGRIVDVEERSPTSGPTRHSATACPP